MRRINWLGLSLLAIFTALLWAPAGVAACELEARPGGVACNGEEGQEIWAIHHPGAWSTLTRYQEGEDPPDVAFLVVGDEFFYSVRGDLVGGRLVDGVIRSRVRFPALISGLARGDQEGALAVELKTNSGPLMVRYRPGDPGPAQWTWDDGGFVRLTTKRDAQVAQVRGPDALREGVERDRTNPYFSLFLVEEALNGGDEAEARHYLEALLNMEGVLWEDLVTAGSLLLGLGFTDEAEVLMERGLEARLALGLTPERMYSVVGVMVLMRDLLLNQLPTMVKAGDREGAHLGMDFLFRVAPFVEGGGAVWLDFADWQEEGGERDLAELWRVRAEENLLRADQRKYGETRRSNRANFRMYVSFVFLVFLVFIISLRGVLRRREKGNGGLLPEPSLLDGALFLLALVLATVMSGRKGSPNGEGHRRVLIREARAG